MTDLYCQQNIRSGIRTTGEFMTRTERKKEVDEFRATHFILGKHPTTLLSEQKFAALQR